MFDTIKIIKPITDVPQHKLVKALSKVKFDKSCIDEESGEVKSRIGKYENLTVRVSQYRLIVEGSLTKFLLGNNALMLSPDQIVEAVKKLNDAFPGISIVTGSLSRVDIAECFVLDHSLLQYFNCLLDSPKLYRNIDHHGVRYSAGKRQMAFYNKTEEAIKNNALSSRLCSSIGCKQMLRIELRYKSQARKLLMNNIGKLTVVHLISRSFQYKIAKAWLSHYNNINKRTTELEQPLMKGWSDFKSYIATIGMETRKLKDWILLLDEIAVINDWTTVNKSKVKRSLTNFYSSNMPSYTDRIKELNSKIERSEIFTVFFLENGRVLKKE